jgi:hypothetical protein
MLQVIKALNKCTFPEIVKDSYVDYLDSEGKRQKFSYPSLANILNSITPELKKNGLRIMQIPAGNGVRTYLFHDSGEFIEEYTNPSIEYAVIQEWSASVTVQRRYAIVSMLGLAFEQDLDGYTEKDTNPKSIGGKPTLDDAKHSAMVKAISEGKHKEVELAMKKYSLTFTQKDELTKLLNDVKVNAFKKSIK